jgi:hypothetical protein
LLARRQRANFELDQEPLAGRAKDYKLEELFEAIAGMATDALGTSELGWRATYVAPVRAIGPARPQCITLGLTIAERLEEIVISLQ